MFNKILKKRKNKKVILKKDDHVHHDWLVALLVLFLVTIIAIVISGLIFFRTSAVKDPNIEIPQSASLIDEELLKDSLLYYQQKEDTYLKYQDTVPIAPSL